MSDNFVYGISAMIKGIYLFLLGVLQNNMVLGFGAGIFVSLMVTGFIIAESPSHVPYMLRYSSADSFQKIVDRHENGTYAVSYSKFSKTHSRVRVLFFVGVILLLILVGAMMWWRS